GLQTAAFCDSGPHLRKVRSGPVLERDRFRPILSRIRSSSLRREAPPRSGEPRNRAGSSIPCRSFSRVTGRDCHGAFVYVGKPPLMRPTLALEYLEHGGLIGRRRTALHRLQMLGDEAA